MIISNKLKSAFEGALVGGGDPASSPLYVFGPFLALIVSANVAETTFGASVWFAVITVVAVSMMYRLVMKWVIDGSGGSGLCEEEFGTWAIKINASITLVEYILTFLVSIAALVTFLSDRFPVLNHHALLLSPKTGIAILLSFFVGLSVTYGPRVSALIFGPATFGVLTLLWAMIIATVIEFGLHFPSVHLAAFNSQNLHYTLGGYARILALITGIEIFANMVPAYQGTAKERSRKAFGSLIIIMGTTSLTMLVVGPAILKIADPLNTQISVFTQTMDALLPKPLAYIGTFLGVMVLLSASSASIHGIQNLIVGLRYRHYVPSWIGSINKHEVAEHAVWIVIAICATTLIIFGTDEHIYLALYAAGVFILLSLTSWASVKRLFTASSDGQNEYPRIYKYKIILAAIFTSAATLIVFKTRFFSGAWIYVVLTPLLYIFFTVIRQKLGAPTSFSDRLSDAVLSSMPLGREHIPFNNEGIQFRNILVPLDQSPNAELSISCAQTIARNYLSTIHFLTVLKEKHKNGDEPNTFERMRSSAREYLIDVRDDLVEAGYHVNIHVKKGDPAKVISEESLHDVDMLIMTMGGKSFIDRWINSTTTTKVIYETTPPLIAIRPTDTWRSIRTRFKRLLVTLDGSSVSEQVIPYAKELALKFSSTVILLSVPEGSDSDEFIMKTQLYMGTIARSFEKHLIPVEYYVTGTDPYQTILQASETYSSDLIMLVSHGRGGIERQEHIRLGSVTERLLQTATCPLFIISAKSSSDDITIAPMLTRA